MLSSVEHYIKSKEDEHRRTSQGGGGGEGNCSPPATEITRFFGQNAHDSGNNTWEKKLHNNTVGVITKTRK